MSEYVQAPLATQATHFDTLHDTREKLRLFRIESKSTISAWVVRARSIAKGHVKNASPQRDENNTRTTKKLLSVRARARFIATGRGAKQRAKSAIIGENLGTEHDGCLRDLIVNRIDFALSSSARRGN